LKENFDRFNFAIYKEKEMVDFRRWITALAVLALFAGLASAQVNGGNVVGTQLSCTANVAVPPQLRAEGLTELIGDIVISCSGGTALAAGATIPTANITVSLGTNVTSRLLGNNGATNSSEALLLIDEPGSGLPTPVAGFGPAAAQTLCTTPSVGAGPGGCVQFAQNVAAVGGGTLPVASSSSTAAVVAPNVFQGLVSANQVTFEGIPILPPVSAGSSRVFRITNIRANVAGLGGGGLPGTTQLLASVSISGSTSLPVANPVLIAGFIQNGLTVTFRNANNSSGLSSGGTGFNQCNTATTLGVATLQYTENFGTAFKVRVAPTSTYTGQAGSPPALQNIPGTIYNSESGFITGLAGLTNGGAVAGLADYGTRLKAVFNNIPTGVRIFVSTTNLASNTSSANTAAPSGNTNTSSYAILINGEASPDANGFPPALSPTTSINSSATGIYEIPVSGGSATAVWEVMNTNPATTETFNFGVYTSYTANPGNNLPPAGTATVNASFAPTPPVPFSASAGSAASASLTIPRFADTSTARNALVINICQTLLLFPFVTNVSGFDTGIAIANTSTDPVGTGAQNGACVMSWYDGTGKTPNVNTGNIATATVYTTLASTSAPGFTGYMMALCNFQFAHGFAFISDIGARNLAMGYLALVVNNGSVTRSGAPSAESLAH
jgi:large repetitive protein